MFYDFTKSFDENINSRNLVSNYDISLEYKRKQNPELYANELKRLTAFIFNNIDNTIWAWNNYDIRNGNHLSFMIFLGQKVHIETKEDINIFELCDLDDVLNLSKKFSIDDEGRLIYEKMEK